MIISLQNFMVRFRNDQRGLTAVEYAVLGGLIVAALVTITGGFTTELTTAFNNIIK